MTATPDRTQRPSRVSVIVRNAAKPPPGAVITSESTVAEDLMIDSLDRVGLIVEFWDQFAVVIAKEAVPNLRRVGDSVGLSVMVGWAESAQADDLKMGRARAAA
jgi:acyl carrier protein